MRGRERAPRIGRGHGGEVAPQPEERARARIDRLLRESGWSVQDYKPPNLHAARGVALPEFPLKDESLADSDNLPPPEMTAREIVDDLEAALEQFKLIAGTWVQVQIPRHSIAVHEARGINQ